MLVHSCATKNICYATEFCFWATRSRICATKSCATQTSYVAQKFFCRQVFTRRKNSIWATEKWFWATVICATNYVLRRAKSFFFISELCHCRGKKEKNFLSASLSTSLPLPLSEPLCRCLC